VASGRDERAATRLLKRLATRGAGPVPANPVLVERLARDGLVERGADGALALTASGRQAVRRALAGADGFALQHQSRSTIIIDDDGERRRVLVNLDESPLSRLRRQKGADGRPLIDDAAFAAGERLRSDFTRAQLVPRVTANWTAAVANGRRSGGAGGMAELTEAVIAARQRVEHALAAVGPEFSGVLLDVCCFLKGVEEIERERAWPVRSAKLVLRLALSSLARHYGLSETAQGRGRGSRIVHWGTDDFRPAIE
jgi:hypothetical protein